MIELIEGLPDGVIGLEAVGEVTSSDYDTVAIPAIEGALERQAKLSVVFVLGERFTGFTSGAEWEDAKLGLFHVRAWDKIAVVTDNSQYRSVMKNVGWLIPGEFRLFSNAERQAAIDWVSNVRRT